MNHGGKCSAHYLQYRLASYRRPNAADRTSPAPPDDWREADEESTAILSNSASKAAWTGNRQARTTMLAPLLGMVPMLDNSGAAGRPLSACQSEEAPTAPPIRPGIAVGVVAVGSPARIAPAALRAPLPASAPHPSRSAIRIAHTAPRAPSVSRLSHAARAPVRIAPIARRLHPRPHRAHRAARPIHRVAAATGPWLARIAPHASLFRRMREKGPLPGNICAKCMLFEIKMAASSPYASISERNRAIQDAWRANLAIKCPLSRRGTRNHAWREDVASAARPFAAAGRGMAERALRPAAGLGSLAACAGPCHLACASRALRPRRAHRRRCSRCRLHRCRRIPPPALPAASATCAARHLRPAPSQTSGTMQSTQCGHKNGTPERGSH